MVRGRPFPRSLARLVRGGVAERPQWLATVEKVPPQFSAVSVRRPPRLVYPEDRLRERFLRDNPEAKRSPMNLKARTKAEAHVADRFVAIQMRAMRELGLSEDAAREHAETALREASERALGLAERVEAISSSETTAGEVSSIERLFAVSLQDAKVDKKMLQSLLGERAAKEAGADKKNRDVGDAS